MVDFINIRVMDAFDGCISPLNMNVGVSIRIKRREGKAFPVRPEIASLDQYMGANLCIYKKPGSIQPGFSDIALQR